MFKFSALHIYIFYNSYLFPLQICIAKSNNNNKMTAQYYSLPLKIYIHNTQLIDSLPEPE